MFECFSPLPFSSGHAGYHRKSKREAEAKGKHINKVNIPKECHFGANPIFWHQCPPCIWDISAKVQGAAWAEYAEYETNAKYVE